MKLISDHSAFSHDLDLYHWMLTGTCIVVATGILVALGYFCWKYRESAEIKRVDKKDSLLMEVSWTSITLVIFILFFWKGSDLYQKQVTPKKADYKIYVFGKRWMWKFHHQNGFVEAGELHLPKDKTVEFVMTSQDVIHSFYIPEYRVKQDVLPETLTHIFIHPLKQGSVSLLCAEYCGTSHARMMAPVTVVDENEYRMLTGLDEPKMSRGEKLFKNRGCIDCHSTDRRLGPELQGMSDDSYIRESILYPSKVVITGYENSMPSYKGALTEEEVRDLIQYIKEMKTP